LHAHTAGRGQQHPRVGTASGSGHARPSVGRLRVDHADTWWAAKAACRDVDPELFFPKPGQNVASAKRICASCPVRMPCLEFALTAVSTSVDDHGVYGGTTERERRRLRRQRLRPASLPNRVTAEAALELALRFGFTETARRLRTSRRTLCRAFEHWQLVPDNGGDRRPSPAIPSREDAVHAFELATKLGLNEAARRLGTSPASLYRAWDRWQLGRPDSSGSQARWARQLHTGTSQPPAVTAASHANPPADPGTPSEPGGKATTAAARPTVGQPVGRTRFRQLVLTACRASTMPDGPAGSRRDA
jgi:WhiB family redox-sensing transcriptional regulator